MDFWARQDVMGSSPLLLGVVVTVAGSGSEQNGRAVLTNEAEKQK